MTTFPIDRYKFYQTGNKIIAVSSYGGKTVRAVAKCDSRDTFSQEKGRELAAARCAEKIAKKRRKRALDKYHEAELELERAKSKYEKMLRYLEDATLGEVGAFNNVERILEVM